MGVAATDPRLDWPDFSCWLTIPFSISIAAPGGSLSGDCGSGDVAAEDPDDDILIAHPDYSPMWDPSNVDYVFAAGTSASAPLVAAIASLVLSQNPDLSGAQLRQVLEKTAVDLVDEAGDEYLDPKLGHGQVDALAAVTNTDIDEMNLSPGWPWVSSRVNPVYGNDFSRTIEHHTAFDNFYNNPSPIDLITSLDVATGINLKFDLDTELTEIGECDVLYFYKFKLRSDTTFTLVGQEVAVNSDINLILTRTAMTGTGLHTIPIMKPRHR